MIADDGPGFSAADPSIYLQRGVRADQREPGEGIGLAAVDQLLREAGGDIRLDNAESGGAVVTLFLPTH